MQDLVRGLREHAISASPKQQRRRSARIANNQQQLHDSGTESDDEELEQIDKATLSKRNYEAFLNGGNPPALSCSPPLVDWDGESRDSVGRESGILTGDNFTDSEDEESVTPKPRRRMCAVANDQATLKSDNCDETKQVTTDKRRRNKPDSPGNFNGGRSTIVAARRCAVKLLVNRPVVPPPSSESEDEQNEKNGTAPPATKRLRLNRPALDFDKMMQTRMNPTAGPVSSAFQSIRQRRRILPSGSNNID